VYITTDNLYDDFSEAAAGAARLVRRFKITSAQVLSLFTSPITLMKAPGAGKTFLVWGWLIHKPAGTAYVVAAGTDLEIRYENNAGLITLFAETTGFLDQTTEQTRFINGPSGAAGTIYGPININTQAKENVPLILDIASANVTTGTSDLYIDLYYSIIPIRPKG